MIKKLDITNKNTAEQVLHIQIPAYQVEADAIGYQEIPRLKDTVQTLQTCGEIFYGYFAPELVGVISCKIGLDICDIHRVVVAPAFLRRGIGKAMVQFLFDHYKDEVHTFTVRTASANVPARKLYEFLGFQTMREECVKGKLNIVVFEKRII